MKYYLLKINGRGKAIKELESGSLAMLKLWALQNTTGKSSCHIADSNGKVLFITIGKGPGEFPEIHDNDSLCNEFTLEGIADEV